MRAVLFDPLGSQKKCPKDLKSEKIKLVGCLFFYSPNTLAHITFIGLRVLRIDGDQ